jgi:phospholipid/cholesterol/gamma-HCH transport system substrate-binding protein
METRASYVAVGSFVLLLIAAFLVFVVWLGRVSFQESADRYLIYFTGPVTGLQEGSAVRVRGIPVGQVVDMRFDPDDISRIRVTIEVQEDTPIRADSVATLDIQGITGVPFVQISGGSEGAPALTVVGDEEYPIIPSRPSTIQAVVESAPLILERAVRLLAAAEGFLSQENQESISRTLANVADMTTMLAGESERVRSLIGSVDGLVMELRVDAARISDQLDATLTAVNGDAQSISRDAAAAVREFRALTTTLTQIAEKVDATVTQIGPNLARFSSTGLTEFGLMASDLRDLARNLSRLTERLERDPSRFLFGGSNQGVPVR